MFKFTKVYEVADQAANNNFILAVTAIFIFIFFMMKNMKIQKHPPCEKIKTKPNAIKEKKVNYKTMKTRSQTKKEEQELKKKETIPETPSESTPPPTPNQPLYAVDIDFDEAKKAWRANKVALKNGCFRYKKTNIRKTI